MYLRIITIVGFIILLLPACQPPKEKTKEPEKKSLEKPEKITHSKAFTKSYNNALFDVYEVDLTTTQLSFHHKDDKGIIYKNFKALKTDLANQGKELIFAMNGGIYDKGNIPKGLYVENGKEIETLDRRNGGGNYYLKPNGVFLIFEDSTATIIETSVYHQSKKKLKPIKYALQSGPLLFSESINFHPKFKEKSTSKYIRNGVGVLPNGHLVFAISKQTVNLYTFGKFFKEALGCRAALYLDGFVSKMYLPELDRNGLSGNFAVIIGESQEF